VTTISPCPMWLLLPNLEEVQLSQCNKQVLLTYIFAFIFLTGDFITTGTGTMITIKIWNSITCQIFALFHVPRFCYFCKKRMINLLQ